MLFNLDALTMTPPFSVPVSVDAAVAVCRCCCCFDEGGGGGGGGCCDVSVADVFVDGKKCVKGFMCL